MKGREAQLIDEAAQRLATVRNLVVTTGAGMSKESGIPTFRDAPSALWENYDPMDLATPEGFQRDPSLVWRWYCDRRRMIATSKPHPGHRAVAELESMFDPFLLLTQNIDNLHREAGSKRLIEVHGNIFRFKCFDRGHPIGTLPDTDEEPPRCHCGSLIRPDIVWFGEMLDADDLERAFNALEQCQAILVVGTSGIVAPAAGFPSVAKSAGAVVIEINPEETPITPLADVFIPAAAGSALPPLVAAVRRLRSA